MKLSGVKKLRDKTQSYHADAKRPYKNPEVMKNNFKLRNKKYPGVIFDRLPV
jgi:hypothetical protein